LIVTVTLNAALDRTVAVPNFRLGHRHRAVDSRTAAGGKGVNVARALKQLGRPVLATGLAGGASRARLLEQLAAEEILAEFTEIVGETRTNLAVVDPTTGEQTEINERGPEVRPEEVEHFIERLLYLSQDASMCVLAGSVPPGVDANIYARVVQELRRLGVTVVIDTEGDPMRAALRAEPDLVAPNTVEAEGVVGPEFDAADDLALGLSGLLEMGAAEAVITTDTGCVAAVRDGGEQCRYEVRIETLEPVTTVGSGDCFLAGYLAAGAEGAGPADRLAFGVACGAESTQHFGAGSLNRREAERLLPQVDVRRLEVPAEVG
jgi:1-phosphofructokinase/tagatose 6-phosphate kinase